MDLSWYLLVDHPVDCLSCPFRSGWLPMVVTLGSGDSDTFTFDTNTGRMSQFKAAIGAGGSSLTGNLTWNGNGSLAQLGIVDQFYPVNSQTCTYTHDDLARINKVDCGSTQWGQTFSFDAFGNITKSVISGHQGTNFWPGYTASTNHFSCSGCTYDNNGNLTYDGYNTYAWDAEGQFSQFQGGTASVYDALGRRAEQTNTSGTSEILYGTDGSKLALMNGTAVQKAFIPLPGGATAVYSSTNLAFYRHPDWLGTSRIASTPVTRAVYFDGFSSPFGEGGWETGTSDHNFTGQNQDLVPNLFYDFPAREYHPGEGRWMSPDPAGVAAVDPANPQSWNRYGYVNNSPLNSVDPLGLTLAECTARNACADHAQQTQSPKAGGGIWNLSLDSISFVNFLMGSTIWTSPGEGPERFTVTLLGVSTTWEDPPGLTADSFTGTSATTATSAAFATAQGTGAGIAKCTEDRHSFFSVAGMGDLAGAQAFGVDWNLRNTPVVSTFGGNLILDLYYGAFGTSSESPGDAANGTAHAALSEIIPAAAGAPLTWGRRTADIMALNLAGKGGLPISLPRVGALNKGLNALEHLGPSLVVDAGFVLGDVLTCVLKPE